MLAFYSFNQIEHFWSGNLPQVQFHGCYYILQEIRLLFLDIFITVLQFLIHPQ